MLLLIDFFLFFLSLLICSTFAAFMPGIHKDVISSTYPFMVSVRHKKIHICGGTLLNRKLILTAANCIYKKKPSNLKVYLTTEKTYDIKTIVWHEDYTEDGDDDIAILKTNVEVPEESDTVKLISNDTIVKADSYGTLVRWYSFPPKKKKGKPRFFGAKLHRTNVYVFNDSICSKIYDMTKVMCVGTKINISAPCGEEKGGPLLLNGTQIGIISYAHSGSCILSQENPKIITRVSKYLDWIAANHAESFCAFFVFKAVAISHFLRFFN